MKARFGLAGLAVALALLAGCAQIPLGSPTPSFAVIEKARASSTAPVSVGEFRLAPGKNPAVDRGLNVRSNTVASPIEGSFAQYMKHVLVTDLEASGLYDPRSLTRISGFLTESTLDVPTGTGQASLGARFRVERAGLAVYDKELRVTSSWPSSFIGVEAIPAGINQYTSLYHMLVGKLLDDPDYRAANPR